MGANVRTFVGGIVLVGAGVALIITGAVEVGTALAVAGAAELGAKAVTTGSEAPHA
jgi:hypothetical protein